MIFRLGKGIRNDLSLLLTHARENRMRDTIVYLCSPDAPATFQFAKYAFFGAVSTLLHLGLFTLFSHTFLPAHDYLKEGGIPDALQERNAILSNLLAFPVAALANYLWNVKFVFTSGRHSRGKEVLLFLGISFLSFALGLFSGPFLISGGLNPWVAQAGMMITSAMVNFICRKFLIFLR
jgi:putative flippase GtrA